MSQKEIHQIFTRLTFQDVEQFYQTYQIWSLQQNISQLQQELVSLKAMIAENAEKMQQVQPSSIALAVLAQLQANHVTDIDVLEKMLEQGDAWLDHTMQLLKKCEQLDLIGGDYTQWCEHALEGAYEWIASMNDNEIPTTSTPEEHTDTTPTDMMNDTVEITEDLMLLKLMSEDGEVNLQTVPSDFNPYETQSLPLNPDQQNEIPTIQSASDPNETQILLSDSDPNETQILLSDPDSIDIQTLLPDKEEVPEAEISTEQQQEDVVPDELPQIEIVHEPEQISEIQPTDEEGTSSPPSEDQWPYSYPEIKESDIQAAIPPVKYRLDTTPDNTSEIHKTTEENHTPPEKQPKDTPGKPHLTQTKQSPQGSLLRTLSKILGR
jgi:hypothetical protein